MGWGRKATQGWERRNRAGGMRAREGTGRAEGHQEGCKDIWGVSLIRHPGWAQLVAQGVYSREQMCSAHGAGPGTGRGLVVGSCSWGQPLGKGSHPRRKRRRRRAGAGPGAEAVGEKGVLEQCWGQQGHPCASHI